MFSMYRSGVPSSGTKRRGSVGDDQHRRGGVHVYRRQRPRVCVRHIVSVQQIDGLVVHCLANRFRTALGCCSRTRPPAGQQVRFHPSLAQFQVVDTGRISDDERSGVDDALKIRAVDRAIDGIAVNEDEDRRRRREDDLWRIVWDGLSTGAGDDAHHQQLCGDNRRSKERTHARVNGKTEATTYPAAPAFRAFRS